MAHRHGCLSEPVQGFSLGVRYCGLGAFQFNERHPSGGVPQGQVRPSGGILVANHLGPAVRVDDLATRIMEVAYVPPEDPGELHDVGLELSFVHRPPSLVVS
jgi:hypothetical protein